jgi:hypothetical protein
MRVHVACFLEALYDPQVCKDQETQKEGLYTQGPTVRPLSQNKIFGSFNLT